MCGITTLQIRTQPPEWNPGGNCLIFKGRFTADYKNMSSIIRLSDRKIIPAPDTERYDNDNVIRLTPARNGSKKSTVNVSSLFDDAESSDGLWNGKRIFFKQFQSFRDIGMFGISAQTER